MWFSWSQKTHNRNNISTSKTPPSLASNQEYLAKSVLSVKYVRCSQCGQDSVWIKPHCQCRIVDFTISASLIKPVGHCYRGSTPGNTVKLLYINQCKLIWRSQILGNWPHVYVFMKYIIFKLNWQFSFVWKMRLVAYHFEALINQHWIGLLLFFGNVSGTWSIKETCSGPPFWTECRICLLCPCKWGVTRRAWLPHYSDFEVGVNPSKTCAFKIVHSLKVQKAGWTSWTPGIVSKEKTRK